MPNPLKSLPLAILLMPAAVCAQNGKDRSGAIDDLIGCRTIREAATRLACFDRAAESASNARASGDLMILDRKTVVARKQQRFGLVTPTSEMFGGGDADASTEVRQLDSKVITAMPAKAYGRFDIQLANGSVWQTIEALNFPPKAGAAVTIKEGAFGSYRLSVEGGRSIGAKRIR